MNVLCIRTGNSAEVSITINEIGFRRIKRNIYVEKYVHVYVCSTRGAPARKKRRIKATAPIRTVQLVTAHAHIRRSAIRAN